MSNGPISITELTRRIKQQLEGAFNEVWVEGELGEVNLSSGGHAYLTLKDEGARINGIIWSSTVRKLQAQPPVGSKVHVFGHLSLYPARGSYQLVVQGIRPAGLGPLQQAFEALKRQLASEGLFDPERKRRPPRLPKAVGLLTSPTGAARRDVESILHRRAPQIPIYLYPAQVQGRGAAQEIAQGLRALSRIRDVEVILLVRGGGSLEDLWAFNEEVVARAIAQCPTPIISGVGHETDTTISDFVADVRVATPSEAAETAVPVREDLRHLLADLSARADRAIQGRIYRARQGLESMTRRTSLDLGLDRLRLTLNQLEGRRWAALGRQLNAARRDLNGLEQRLSGHSPQARLTRARAQLGALDQRLGFIRQRLVEGPRRRLEEAARRLEPFEALLVEGPRRALGALERRLGRAMEARRGQARGQLSALIGPLEALSPLRVLERGYSIALSDEGAVKDARDLSVGDELVLRLHRGQLKARVTEVEPVVEEVGDE